MSQDGVYFNENDPFAAAWLRNLFPWAHVDERSIADVRATDVLGYRRGHFFGGIGGWEYAIGLAGWPAERVVWTGSCPCQPFSQAGKQRGEDDPRHLWPAFRQLIAECRPATIFGEQVASCLGREWLAGVRADLEGMGYAVGAADLCAAGAGAPHIRQRLFWVAQSRGAGLEERQEQSAREECEAAERGGMSGGVGDANGAREGEVGGFPGGEGVECPGGAGFWDAFDLVHCRDGKLRRIEPGSFPLAHGVPARVGRLRGYGNAIVPQLAAIFIRAFMEA